MSDVPTIQQALAKVMAQVQNVGKDGHNKSQDYRFRGVDAVVNAVGPALREHGVIVLPHAESAEYESYQTRNGAHMKGCVVRVRFVFVGPAGDTLECVVYGESSDPGDKATPKAHSVAFRTALLQALCIPTDDPDPDSQSHERAERPQHHEPPAPAGGAPVCAGCGESLAGAKVVVRGNGRFHEKCEKVAAPEPVGYPPGQEPFPGTSS